MEKERRAKLRYPLELNARYQTLGMANPVAGIGQTVNVSSSGAFIACGANFREGTRLRVVIEWPSLLNGTTPLQLVTLGTVVRRQHAGLAIAFEGYQFRTAGRRGNVATMPDLRPSTGYSSANVANVLLAAKSSR
jgi:PilZ domain